MCWIVVFPNGEQKFYSLEKVADFLGIPKNKVKKYKNKKSFVIGNCIATKQEDNSLFGRWAKLQERLIGVN